MIENIPVPHAEVPIDFQGHAERLGFETHQLLWLLAEGLCVNPPTRITVVTQSTKKPRPKPGGNIIPFPGRREDA